MVDIFISYANEDRERVVPIVKALEDQGWSVWWDWTSIPVGKTWRQFVQEGLNASECVLVLWSKISIHKEWVLEEADHGKERKILVPALIDDVRPPLGFGQIQAARLTEWKGEPNHPGFGQLLNALEDLIGLPESKKKEQAVPEALRPTKKASSRKEPEQHTHPDLDAMIEIPVGEFIYQDGKATIKKPYAIDVYEPPRVFRRPG